LEVPDARPAFCSQNGLCGTYEIQPTVTVDAVFFVDAHVDSEPVLGRQRTDTPRNPNLVLPKVSQPIRNPPAPVYDVELTSGDRSHGIRHEPLRNISRQHADLSDALEAWIVVRLVDQIRSNEREQGVDSKLGHHRRRAINPAVLILN